MKIHNIASSRTLPGNLITQKVDRDAMISYMDRHLKFNKRGTYTIRCAVQENIRWVRDFPNARTTLMHNAPFTIRPLPSVCAVSQQVAFL